MSSGGGGAGLLELVVGFFAAVVIIAVIAVVVRRRGGHQDLLGAQMREMQARAAADPGAEMHLRDEAARVAAARIADAGIVDARIHSNARLRSDARVGETGSRDQERDASGAALGTGPGERVSASDATVLGVGFPDATAADQAGRDARAADATAPEATAPDSTAAGSTAAGSTVPDSTVPPDEWPGGPAGPGGRFDAMADTFAWLRIAALVEAGQHEQAVELLSTTMVISADEARLLVGGLNDAVDPLGGRPLRGDD